MELLLDSIFNGVAIGSVLLVAALGLAIVFGLMGVINLAHGELMMLGAYTTYVTQLIFKLPILKPFYNSYIIVSIFLAFIVSGVVGILLEKTIIRRLYGSPLETLLATWGVSLILQQFVRSVPLAYGTGLIISLLIGLFLPTTFPSKIKESINFKYFKFSSWIFAALTGVLTGNIISSSVSKLSRASARNVDVTAPSWMRGQVEIIGTAFPKTRLMIIVITLISVIAITCLLYTSPSPRDH